MVVVVPTPFKPVVVWMGGGGEDVAWYKCEEGLQKGGWGMVVGLRSIFKNAE